MNTPTVMRAILKVRRGEGKGLLRMTTERTRLTRGVHLLIAPYMGMFIPCRAIRDKVLCVAKLRLQGRNSIPSLREYPLSLIHFRVLRMSRNIIVTNI